LSQFLALALAMMRFLFPAATLTMIKWPVLRTLHAEAHILLATFQDHPTGQARWLLEFMPNAQIYPAKRFSGISRR
jgi:hypothetical protein